VIHLFFFPTPFDGAITLDCIKHRLFFQVMAIVFWLKHVRVRVRGAETEADMAEKYYRLM